MAQRHIDLNADLGEGFGAWTMGDDRGMLDIVTSANVACGFHAGDPSIMRAVCERAVERGVVIGAHVGYRDLIGFGRRRVDVAPDALENEVLYQVGALDAVARAAGDRVRYVKPHGALYNAIVADARRAAAVARAVRRFDADLAVLGLPGSAFLDAAADRGLTAVPEAFADRAYTAEGHLVPRGHSGAVLDDPGAIARRVTRLAREGRIVSVDGTPVASPARSVCVHGDTPGAVEIARGVRRALDEAGVTVAPFVR
ncbi:MAG TPA: 5-oxoprolinase subunit PxpA [Stackebrandtia sp.]|uniref:LamB/YcsF family protein n=1 Tax=Stackebrandtia sp. TaxID=2023065 RepID=UPI002D667683|nr:5-oxoprolinase subunit PxpA [Stackebrandtia sp.]HZE40257.1 5-oxoprolinase subunit PxpA [Stackebrandtia sp.]